MIKNKLIITGILGVSIALGAVTITDTVVNANVIKSTSEQALTPEKKKFDYCDAVEAVNNFLPQLCNAKDSNNIKELRRLVNEMHEAINTAERMGIEDRTIESLRMKEDGWTEELAEKEVELANTKKKSATKEDVPKHKTPVEEKKETKPTKKKSKENTEIKATKQQVYNQPNTKVEEPKKVLVKEEPTPTEVQENVKEDVTPSTTPVKNEDTPKDVIVNKVELEADNTESTLLAKVMIIVGAILVSVGAVTAIKVRKKN